MAHIVEPAWQSPGSFSRFLLWKFYFRFAMKFCEFGTCFTERQIGESSSSCICLRRSVSLSIASFLSLAESGDLSTRTGMNASCDDVQYGRLRQLGIPPSSTSDQLGPRERWRRLIEHTREEVDGGCLEHTDGVVETEGDGECDLFRRFECEDTFLWILDFDDFCWLERFEQAISGLFTKSQSWLNLSNTIWLVILADPYKLRTKRSHTMDIDTIGYCVIA